jgi:hypothetical protein
MDDPPIVTSPPPIPPAAAGQKTGTIVVKLVLILLQVQAALALGYMGWGVHYELKSQATPGPFFLLAFGMLLLAWGAAWNRLWTLILSPILTIAIPVLAVSSIDYNTTPSPYNPFSGIIGLVLIAGVALALAMEQAALGLLVAWSKRWRPWSGLTPLRIALEIGEVVLACAMLPLLYHLDFRLPAAIKAKYEAQEEYFHSLRYPDEAAQNPAEPPAPPTP